LSSLERGERASEPKKKGRIPVNGLKKIVDEVKK